MLRRIPLGLLILVSICYAGCQRAEDTGRRVLKKGMENEFYKVLSSNRIEAKLGVEMTVQGGRVRFRKGDLSHDGPPCGCPCKDCTGNCVLSTKGKGQDCDGGCYVNYEIPCSSCAFYDLKVMTP